MKKNPLQAIYDTGFAIQRFFYFEVWEADEDDVSWFKSLLYRVVRTVMLTFRSVEQDALSIHASALTYITLMSLVPMFAIVLSVLNAWGLGENAINSMVRLQEDMPQQFQDFINHLINIVKDTNFKKLGWVGVAGLVFTSTLVLNGVEHSFNRIWGISHRRNILKRVSNYISLILIVPILIGIAGTIATFMEQRIMENIKEDLNLIVKCMPTITAWFAFTFLYLSLPNTKVNNLAACIGGFFAGVLWLVWQQFFINMSIYLIRFNYIYGAFAAIPIFLAWLYVAWLIVLLGAELTFAIQNHNTLYLERGDERTSVRSKQMLLLAVLMQTSKVLTGPEKYLDLHEYARAHRIPLKLLNEIVDLLVNAGYLVEVAEKPECYVLVRSPELILIRDVVSLVVDTGSSPAELGVGAMSLNVKNILRKMDKALKEALDQKTIKDLLAAG